jgi:hypothetical protein
MTRRRRCCVCGELFAADPRVGARQKACGLQECQRERHRRACKAWREREGPAAEEDRLRRRLGASEGELRLDVVRDECGAVFKVVLEESLILLSRVARDEFATKAMEQRRDLLRFVERGPRDERGAPGPGP